MSKITDNYRKKKTIFLVLSVLCIVGPLMFYFGRAFICGDAVQKFTLGITFTVALVLFVINRIMKSHFRSVIWVLVLGIFTVIQSYLTVILVVSITTFLEELIFYPLYRHYKAKTMVNKEIDRRYE